MRAAGRVALALLLASSGAAGARAADIGAMIDAGWKVQQRWQSLTRNGSFEYDFDLRTWNPSNELKESLERVVRVQNRDGQTRSEVLLARKDGKDETEKIRAEESKAGKKRKAESKDDFPSPFDPRYREKYLFEVARDPDGRAALVFHPARPFERAVEGRCFYDPEGRLREASFALARNPVFTHHLRFDILFDEDGNPTRVGSTGEVSLIVWKRRFESGVTLKDVRLAGTP